MEEQGLQRQDSQAEDLKENREKIKSQQEKINELNKQVNKF